MSGYRIGERVSYRGSWGRGVSRSGEITGTGVKNDERVYDVRLDDGAVHWGYADQFRPETDDEHAHYRRQLELDEIQYGSAH